MPYNERKGIYADERIEWVKVINSIDGKQLKWRDYSDPTKKIRKTFFTHSFPENRPPKVSWPLSARYTAMPETTYVYPTLFGIPALAKQYTPFKINRSLLLNIIEYLGAFIFH